MPVTPSSPFQARYESEVRALRDACRSVAHGARLLAEACDEALDNGGQVTCENCETTISTSYRMLMKTLGVVFFLQTTGARVRRKLTRGLA